jgi:U3 small nucleolar ribonucleoprotein component
LYTDFFEVKTGNMAKSQKAKAAPPSDEELAAWEHFEKAVDNVMRGGPQHRLPKAEKPKSVDADHQ